MSSARALCTITKDDKALTVEYLSKLAKKGSEMCTKIVESSKQLKACATYEWSYACQRTHDALGNTILLKL